MAALFDQVQLWLASQGKTGRNIIDYELSDRGDGKGPFINRWNEEVLGTKPTARQLADIDTTPEENKREIIESEANYPITPRMLREIALGQISDYTRAWVEECENKIKTLRGK